MFSALLCSTVVWGEYSQEADASGEEYQSQPVEYAAQPATYSAPAVSCHCTRTSPCFEPSTGQCVQAVSIKQFSYTEPQAAESYGGQQTAETTGQAQYRHLQGYHQDTGAEQFFMCDKTCPSGSFKCTARCNKVDGFGKSWSWVTFTILLLAGLYFTRFGLVYKGTEVRLYRILPFWAAAACFVGALSWLVLASGRGTIHNSCFDQRPINFARYLDWLFTTPIMLMQLGFLGGISMEQRFLMFGFDVTMILAGFCGSYTTSGWKWFFFLIGVLCLVPIFWVLRSVNFPAGATSKKTYDSAVAVLAILWIIYAVLWVIFDGGVTHSCASNEAIAYGIVDLVSKVGFGFMVVSAISSKKYTAAPVSSSVAAGGSFL